MVGRPRTAAAGGLDRRQFLGWTAKRGIGPALAGGALPTLLAACSDDDRAVEAGPSGGHDTTATSVAEATEKARAVVGDVIDFSLTPDGCDGAFGFVTMKLYRGSVDGKDVWFVRTDASDRGFATTEKLVFVPEPRAAHRSPPLPRRLPVRQRCVGPGAGVLQRAGP
jgi:hypothetical protein